MKTRDKYHEATLTAETLREAGIEEVSRADQAWAADISYIGLGKAGAIWRRS